MRNSAIFAVLVLLTFFAEGCGQAPEPAAPSTRPATQPTIAGSQSCRECHQHFYNLWSTSFHGLAMQPFTMELVKKQLTAPPKPIAVGKNTYQADFSAGHGSIRETTPQGETRFPIEHVMGGKNVYYFLTSLDRGRLQVLPVAYDVRRAEWFDTAASAMRHFQGPADQPLDWRDPLYTFNTSCNACHVSQLTTNYDPKSESYHTTWLEAGINCETCHGPSSEHVKLFKQLPEGQKSTDLKLIRFKSLSVAQQNDSCSSCHAKAAVLGGDFKPGDRFFDHFDLTAYENQDFYPDGRDLGENYTFTSWRRSPCAISGQLSCVHCHTSSGRYRFAEDRTNAACLPCHADRVKDVAAHTHHKADSDGSQCITCHMPMTEFARMRRSDHSMLPPTPATTLAFKSPNACNLCHADKDAAWSDKQVRSWHKDDYQAPVLRRATLLDTARRNDWSHLSEILAYIQDPKRDEVYATSLVRLLANCADPRKQPALIAALKDASPLVRAAAASALGQPASPEVAAALLKATADDYRLVRIRAASTLVSYPADQLSSAERDSLTRALGELEASLKSRPDDWASLYNLGNYYTERSQISEALESFHTSSHLRPDAVQPLVNAAILHARVNQSAEAEQALVKAIGLDPANAVANFNLGLLRAEQGDLVQAEQMLRTALKTDPTMAPAAYNLAILRAKDHLSDAIDLLRQACRSDPANPRYAYTLAFYLAQAGNSADASAMLQKIVAENPDYFSAYGLLADLFEKDHRPTAAAAVYRVALTRPGLPPEDRQLFQFRLSRIEGR